MQKEALRTYYKNIWQTSFNVASHNPEILTDRHLVLELCYIFHTIIDITIVLIFQ